VSIPITKDFHHGLLGQLLQLGIGWRRRGLRLQQLFASLDTLPELTLRLRRQVTELEVPCVARPGGRFNRDGG